MAAAVDPLEIPAARCTRDLTAPVASDEKPPATAPTIPLDPAARASRT